ncbi:hypothetical protein [uncultured Brevundimonas sp.]|uniref:hypothetical protein n=1 Tax=uncultured Brevundimonas sp. TaxID=213418 RepID=UPI0030EBE855|tara:strand:+ start:16184 stop:16765 length:582 start_codon:yes stop_codon:yes gene_type:complete
MSAAVAFHPQAATARQRIAAETCPVATLADEAAALIDAWAGMNAAIAKAREAGDGDQAPVGPMIGDTAGDEDAEQLTAKVVRKELSDRIKAVGLIATHRPAASAKGAAYQALILNHQLIAMLDAGIDGGAKAADRDRLQNATCEAERALVSIVRYLDDASGGLPPPLVDYYCLSATERAPDAADRAVVHFSRR